MITPRPPFWNSVGIVAQREIRARILSKSFLISTLITLVVILLVMVLMPRMEDFFGGGPDTVARKVERAITARRPRTRYKVTPSASLSMASRRLMTDRMWDRFVGTQMPRPG